MALLLVLIITDVRGTDVLAPISVTGWVGGSSLLSFLGTGPVTVYHGKPRNIP